MMGANTAGAGAIPAPLFPRAHPRKAKRLSIPTIVIRVALRTYATDLRRIAVNRYTWTASEQAYGYAHGVIMMAHYCGRISDARRDRFQARLERISNAKITRLDPRRPHKAPA